MGDEHHRGAQEDRAGELDTADQRRARVARRARVLHRGARDPDRSRGWKRAKGRKQMIKPFAIALALALPAWPQVNTEVPPVIAGAKPVAVERVKVHGAALEGNLEGNAADRDVLVFLPP